MSEHTPPSDTSGSPDTMPAKGNSSVLLVIISLIALGVAAYLIVTRADSLKEEKMEGAQKFWVYDIENDALTVMGPEDYPPVALPGGGTGYWATVYSCTDENTADTREIALLTKYSDEARAARIRGVGEADLGLIAAPESTLVATLEMAKRGEWVPSAGNREQLIAEATAECPRDPVFHLPE